jgi:dTDP-glucose 4,6-dehydratase/UDP-glucuronate decarboxylase
MKILVTGGSGVIGKSLVKNLLNRGFLIDATYNKNKISNSPKSFINFIPYGEILKSKGQKKYDQIWHFATYGQPAKFMKSWREVIKLNIYDLEILTSLLKDNGHFFYASTSELYGNQKSDEFTIPTSDPLSQRSIYTESKRLGEAILNKELGERATFFRICLAYSPNFYLGDNRVIYELIVKALTKDSINLIDDGSSQRQYIFIDDAISMMEDIAFNLLDKKNSKNGPWNICNPSKISILELAELIGGLLDKPVIIGPKDKNPLHALSKVEIIPKRYQQTFGEYKYTDLTYGIKKVINSAEEQLNL